MVAETAYLVSFPIGFKVEGMRIDQIFHVFAFLLRGITFFLMWAFGSHSPILLAIVWAALFVPYIGLAMRLGCLPYERAYTRGKYKVGTK
jgi:hypothetical protein